MVVARGGGCRYSLKVKLVNVEKVQKETLPGLETCLKPMFRVLGIENEVLPLS